jgi:hypothetical protein
MSLSINSIIWPKDNLAAQRHYVSYMIKVLSSLEIEYAGWERNPVHFVEGYIAGRCTSEQCRAEAIAWWSYIDSRGESRELRDPQVLMARLAICLLSIDEGKVGSLGESLSWFIEVLGFMGKNTRTAITIMAEHFEFQQR